MAQEEASNTDEPRTPKIKLKKPSKQTLLVIALIIMTLVIATLASALVLEMIANSDAKNKINDLERSIDSLESTIDDLEDQKADLEVEKRSLQDQVDILLNLTYDQDDQIVTLQSQIAGLNSQISDLQDQITTLQNDNQLLSTENDAWWYIFEMRTGHHLSDMITPDDPTITAQSQQILGADADGNLNWSDMRTINDWVFTNIIQSKDPVISSPTGDVQDYWLKPNETLNRGEGDSEDMANLALSLMLAEENVTFAWAALVTFASGTAHVGIFVNVVNDTMYIFDPAWGWESSTNQNESAALTEWANAGGESGVDRVWAAYLDIEVVEFTTLQEFYDWF